MIKKKELLFSITKKDFKIDYFSGTGAGGQHRNKHQNCVRLTHIESGIMVVGQNHRTRDQNLKDAFLRLTSSSKFNIWLKTKIHGTISEKIDIETKVDDMMKPSNLKIEIKDSESNKWKLLEDSICLNK